MNILITGGCGYIGTVLVLNLLKENHRVRVIDNRWFGNYLPKHNNLENIKDDIRNLKDEYFADIEVVVHLANIANDIGVELNENLSWEINVLATINLIESSIKNNVKKFIYASSGSVYGIKNELEVTENLSLVPISTYNKTKMVSEKILLSYIDEININIIRPATVCGLSPRMRFDLTVNMFISQAYFNKKITVFGGTQSRPNIHIDDLIEVYRYFIFKDYPNGCYNAGFENLTIIEIANLVKSYLPCEIETHPTKDLRSYRQNSDKLINLGFKRKYKVEKAIIQIYESFKNDGLTDNENNHTVKWMKKNNFL